MIPLPKFKKYTTFKCPYALNKHHISSFLQIKFKRKRYGPVEDNQKKKEDILKMGVIKAQFTVKLTQ